MRALFNSGGSGFKSRAGLVVGRGFFERFFSSSLVDSYIESECYYSDHIPLKALDFDCVSPTGDFSPEGRTRVVVVVKKALKSWTQSPVCFSIRMKFHGKIISEEPLINIFELPKFQKS
jgi:hypothetical protein